MKKYGRVDGNQARIVEELRANGYTVQSLAPLGNGVPDLLVGCGNDKNLLFEVKTEKGKLTPDQIEWARKWNNPVYLVNSPLEALRRARKARFG
jgi:hypothetical protein